MTDRKNQLIHEVGNLIISDERYVNPEPDRKLRNWDALSLVVNVASQDKGATGYVYEGEKCEARVPREARLLIKKLQELQELTKSPEGKTWKQCLIHITRQDHKFLKRYWHKLADSFLAHITKPGYKINIQFEYDDPRRWSLKKVSLNMADYANSLRPPGE